MIMVYAVDISNMDITCYKTLYAAASTERKVRADRCRKPENARCTIVAGALLRYCAKQYLGTEAFTLEKNEHGKPRLKEWPGFYFNISHSGHWVVLAWGNTEVGIDVQTMDSDEKTEKIAHRFFTRPERDYVMQTQGGKTERFYRVWTAKESYLKYLGTGLQKPLNSFCVRSMEHPNFFFRQLCDCAMTLCTEEDSYQLEILQPEQLL